MMINTIVLRCETKANEYRTPLIPENVEKLINNGFKVYVERSENRCFENCEYEKYGAELITYDQILKLDKMTTLIVGLKELPESSELFGFQNLYFAHCYKNQSGSEKILKSFQEKSGYLFDLEFLLDANGKRLVAFGFYAGFVGALLGVMQHIRKNNGHNISNLVPIFNLNALINRMRSEIITNNIHLNVAIIGISGRCGKGAEYLCKLLNVNYKGYTSEMEKNDLHNYNLIVNCIYLAKDKRIDPFITFDTLHKYTKYTVVSDVSCDFSNENNPIKIYNELTTHANPIKQINDNIDLISIDNLPSLIPIESSTEFSNQLTNLLLEINTDPHQIWERNINIFIDKIKESLS